MVEILKNNNREEDMDIVNTTHISPSKQNQMIIVENHIDQIKMNNNTAHNSITSSVVNLQRKLNEVISPSSSKPDEDDEYGNDIDDD